MADHPYHPGPDVGGAFPCGSCLRHAKEKDPRHDQSICNSIKTLKKSIEEIHTALNSLCRIDIIYSQNKRYYFRNIPFKFFLRYKYLGLEQYEYEKSGYYVQKIKELDESFRKVSSELGGAKELELYYIIAKNQGNKFWGIKIPHFKILKKGHLEQGKEFDLYGVTLRGKVWVFELKWKEKLTGIKEVQTFLKKISAYKYVFISKSGFTEEVMKQYKEHKHVYLLLPVLTMTKKYSKEIMTQNGIIQALTH